MSATLPKYYSTAEQYNGISQVGAVASWPIADRWSIVGAYFYDTNANKQADSMLGVCNTAPAAMQIGVSYSQEAERLG